MQKHILSKLRDCVLLYVEDDDATAYLFQTALAENGIAAKLYRVTDGEAALSFLRRNGPFQRAPRPDLVILDLNLPGMSGLETLREIRSDAGLSHLSAVVFSSSSQPSDRTECLAAGADAYFTKQPNLDAFIDTVRTICESVPAGPVLRTA
jgi:CheY-like chemotaxis protein